MKERFIMIWQIVLFTLGAALFVQLLALFGDGDGATRFGRVVMP